MRIGLCARFCCHCSVERVVDDMGALFRHETKHTYMHKQNRFAGCGIARIFTKVCGVCWIWEELHLMDKSWLWILIYWWRVLKRPKTSALTKTKTSNIPEFGCSIKTKHNQKLKPFLFFFSMDETSTVPTANLKACHSISSITFLKYRPLGAFFWYAMGVPGGRAIFLQPASWHKFTLTLLDK